MEIIQRIYKSCDEKNTNSVKVLSLIEFIKPYMMNNLDELVLLQNQLDPENSNPSVDYPFFEEVMIEWIAKMQGDSVMIEFPASFNRTSNLEVSNIKSLNNVGDSTLEEQVCKLKYQLNKVTAELDLVKQQLNTCEEHNEALLADLKSCRRARQRDQIGGDEVLSPKEDENCEEEEEEGKDKLEQLQKMLTISKKEQDMYLTHIRQLENENHSLKNKLQASERIKREGRKSLGEMRECLDVKENEISRSIEMIEKLKCELEEKDERLSFYTNEHKLLKQRIVDLESFLQSNVCSDYLTRSVPSKNHVFNTPKLLNQLAHPVSPITNTKEFITSSPIENPTLESGNSSDFFNIDVIRTVLQSPRKSLKEELTELNDSCGNFLTTLPKKMLNNKNDDEIERLHELVKQQEDIKNSLWLDLKQMLNENTSLQCYKKDYFDLLHKVEEKNRIIEKLEQKLNTAERYTRLQDVLDHLTNVETNLKEQKFLSLHLQQSVQVLKDVLDREETKFTTQLIFSKKLLYKEKPLHAALPEKKTFCDKSIETEKEENRTTRKQTNFTKQQMKVERLLEKIENIERNLSTERTINTKLTRYYQEACATILKLEDDLNTNQKKLIDREENLNNLIIENNSYRKRVEMLEIEKTNRRLEIDQLKEYNRELANNNRCLNENLNSVTDALKNLRTEHELLLNKQVHMERKMNEEHIVKKSSINSATSDDMAVQQLRSDLTVNKSELRNLKKQFELINVEYVVSVINEELKNAALNIIDILHIDGGLIQEMIPETDQRLGKAENEIIMLKSNVKMITVLLKNLSDKYLSSLNEQKDDDSEENLIATAFTEMKAADIIPSQCDSFLENLCIDAQSRLSYTEIEEKFATLAVFLTVDNRTAEKRYLCEEKNMNHLVLQFVSSLNGAIHFLNSNKKNKVHKNLQILKDISQDLLKSAFQYGVLHYEKRTINYWKLVINYLAVVGRQRKECNKSDTGNRSFQDEFSEENSLCNVPQSSNLPKRIKFCVCTLFLISVGCVVALLFYIDQMCPKNRGTCPLQWITDMFIEKTYNV